MKPLRSVTAVAERNTSKSALTIYRQSGNVLFLILIAVALFAALSYAVTSSSRGGDSTGFSREKAKLAAAELVQYGIQLEQAILRMKMVNKCLDTQISFENPIDPDYLNPNAPASGSCHVFLPSGGGAAWKTIDAQWQDPSSASVGLGIPDTACARYVGTDGSGTTADSFCDTDTGATELILAVYGIRPEICAEINQSISGNPAIPVDLNHQYSLLSHRKFKGSFGQGFELGDSAGVLDYKRTYCYKSSSSAGFAPDTYSFYHVLVAR